ncbi:hypothetical protein Droror1_Dr00005314 [Drosera rotundifolia]
MIMMRRRSRGFKLRSRLSRFFKWVFRRRTNSNGCRRLKLSSSGDEGSVVESRICRWGDLIRRGARELCFFKNTNRRTTGYVKMGSSYDYEEKRAGKVPRGHLAVCVGETDEEVHKVVVPVIYLNHPLFAELLKEAEEIYGFDHPGEIKLPCPMEKFETVKTRILHGEVYGRPWQGYHRTVKCSQF